MNWFVNSFDLQDESTFQALTKPVTKRTPWMIRLRNLPFRKRYQLQGSEQTVSCMPLRQLLGVPSCSCLHVHPWCAFGELQRRISSIHCHILGIDGCCSKKYQLKYCTGTFPAVRITTMLKVLTCEECWVLRQQLPSCKRRLSSRWWCDQDRRPRNTWRHQASQPRLRHALLHRWLP